MIMTLSFNIVPIISASPVNASILLNTEAVFTCSVTMRDTTENISIEWNGPVNNLPAQMMVADSSTNTTINSVLRVNVTDDSYEGSYNCTASYTMCQGSVTSRSAELSIVPRPTILQVSIQVGVVNVGDAIVLNCSAAIDGNLSITWTGPRPVESISEYFSTTLTSTANITINSLEYGGIYTCVATNEAGKTTENATIIVNPEIAFMPSDASVSSGDKVNISCLVQTLPASTVHWEKLDNFGIFNALNDETNFTLTINRVFFGSKGSYRCVVSFPFVGDFVSRTGILTGKY